LGLAVIEKENSASIVTDNDPPRGSGAEVSKGLVARWLERSDRHAPVGMKRMSGERLSAFPAAAKALAGILDKSSDRTPLAAFAPRLLHPEVGIDFDAQIRVRRVRGIPRLCQFVNRAV